MPDDCHLCSKGYLDKCMQTFKKPSEEQAIGSMKKGVRPEKILNQHEENIKQSANQPAKSSGGGKRSGGKKGKKASKQQEQEEVKEPKSEFNPMDVSPF